MLNGVPRILIIRLSAIGDVVRVLPALHALRDRYPTAQIDWAVESKSSEVVLGHPAIDQCLVFDRSKPGRLRRFLEFCGTIRENHYDIVIDFHGIFKSGWMTLASRAKARVGFERPRAQELSWLTTNQRATLHSSRLNRIEENLELCKLLGAKRHELNVVIAIPEDVQDEVDEYMEGVFMGGKRLALIHPPVDRPEKQWPLENFAALADLLLEDGRFEVLLSWGPGQLKVAEDVQALCRRRPPLAPETPGLKHFAALVQHANLFVSGDTGPMHIASAMGVPVVGIFGGTDPAKHAPMRLPSEALYAGPKFFPGRVTLGDAQRLLAGITPEMAYDACIRTASS